MPYSITVGVAQILPPSAFAVKHAADCNDVARACMPPFVFSVPGQVNFRRALEHLLSCNRRDCSSLRVKVRIGMQDKLKWLFKEEAYLGCVHLQPFLYGSQKVVNLEKKRNFELISHHLAHCPHEACATLRRAVLLTIRDLVSPNAREKAF